MPLKPDMEHRHGKWLNEIDAQHKPTDGVLDRK